MKFHNYVAALLSLVLTTSVAFGQQKPAAKPDTSHAAIARTTIRTAANLKSGASQDVLSSFFKLAYSDVSNTHNFGFSSSLFAVRAKTDTSLWIDNNYKKQVFARNFVFGINYGLDTNFKFKSAALNLKYAIINNRDKNLFDFGPGKVMANFQDLGAKLCAKAENLYFLQNRPKYATQHQLINNFYAFTNPKNKTKKNDLPAGYIHLLDSLQRTADYQEIKGMDMEKFRDSLKSIYGIVSGLMAKRGIWTAGAQVFTAPNNLVSKANFNTEYLKGITNTHSSMGAELDFRGNWNIYDSTLVKTVYHRQVISASAGINWIIYKDKQTQKSYIEFKPSLTYVHVLSGQYTGETKSKFTGDGVLRFRVTDDLWVPITITYDPDKGKVLGFLNLTSNFDWLGGKKK